MNGFLLIGLFTAVLIIALYLLQSRQSKLEMEEDPEEQVKIIEHFAPVEEESEEVAPEPETEVVESPTREVDIELIPGIGPTYRSLLREAEVSTVNQVAEYSPSELHALLLETNERESIAKRPPTLANVEAWVESAKRL